jgi:hypothetical protein
MKEPKKTKIKKYKCTNPRCEGYERTTMNQSPSAGICPECKRDMKPQETRTLDLEKLREKYSISNKRDIGLIKKAMEMKHL